MHFNLFFKKCIITLTVVLLSCRLPSLTRPHVHVDDFSNVYFQRKTYGRQRLEDLWSINVQYVPLKSDPLQKTVWRKWSYAMFYQLQYRVNKHSFHLSLCVKYSVLSDVQNTRFSDTRGSSQLDMHNSINDSSPIDYLNH